MNVEELPFKHLRDDQMVHSIYILIYIYSFYLHNELLVRSKAHYNPQTFKSQQEKQCVPTETHCHGMVVCSVPLYIWSSHNTYKLSRYCHSTV